MRRRGPAGKTVRIALYSLHCLLSWFGRTALAGGPFIRISVGPTFETRHLVSRSIQGTTNHAHCCTSTDDGAGERRDTWERPERSAQRTSLLCRLFASGPRAESV